MLIKLNNKIIDLKKKLMLVSYNSIKFNCIYVCTLCLTSVIVIVLASFRSDTMYMRNFKNGTTAKRLSISSRNIAQSNRRKQARQSRQCWKSRETRNSLTKSINKHSDTMNSDRYRILWAIHDDDVRVYGFYSRVQIFHGFLSLKPTQKEKGRVERSRWLFKVWNLVEITSVEIRSQLPLFRTTPFAFSSMWNLQMLASNDHVYTHGCVLLSRRWISVYALVHTIDIRKLLGNPEIRRLPQAWFRENVSFTAKVSLLSIIVRGNFNTAGFKQRSPYTEGWERSSTILKRSEIRFLKSAGTRDFDLELGTYVRTYTPCHVCLNDWMTKSWGFVGSIFKVHSV